MEDFPSNSQRQRGPSEPKKIERVTSAEAVRRKRGLGRQFKEVFIGGDARTAFNYMIIEVVVPAIQDTMIDAFQGGVERLIRGDSARPRRGGTIGGYGNVGRVNYQSMSTPASSNPSGPRMVSRRSRAKGTFDELII